MEVLCLILKDILSTFYQGFLNSLLLSFLFMAVYRTRADIKRVLQKWLVSFRKDKNFRRMFFLAFYTAMILYRTLLSRSIWGNPLSDVVGVWGLYRTGVQGNAVLTPEVPENLLLFVPFSIFYLWVYAQRRIHRIRLWKVLLCSAQVSFLFSFLIETSQLLFRLGTWQLSDLFFNTLGGILGGVIYYIGLKLRSATIRTG